MRIKDIITHIFDWHIMKKRNWTLEQLVAWVETVEPKNYDPPGIIKPELLEWLSQWQAAQPRQAVGESRAEEEREDADEWQARVSAFEARHSSARRRGASTP